jgi:zinc protease
MRVIILGFLTLLSSFAFSQTKEFTLDNGLKVVVKEDHRAPVVISMIWYKVGSADEKGGSTGLSHALEHMMFKGTTKYPLGVFSKTIASLGGQENAFTNTDYTGYFEQLAKQHLKTSFELEADRMQHLLLTDEEFGKEIKVIQEERRLRTDDNPQALTYERFMAAANLSAPYHHPVIGWMSDLHTMTAKDARNWYNQYYAPNNATLVVVGDVKPQEVFTLAKRYFGGIKAKTVPLRKPQVEPPALGKKEVVVHAPAKIPMLMLGYTVPTVNTVDNAKSNDPYALELAAGLLDSGDNGRLVKDMTRGNQTASDTAILYNLYARYQTQFTVYGTPSQNHTVEDIKKGFLNQLNLLKTTIVSEQELQRIKTQIIAQKVFERDSIYGQAQEIGTLETVGLGWQVADEYIERINKVTAEDIKRVAKQYFNNANLTQAQLKPKDTPGQKQ